MLKRFATLWTLFLAACETVIANPNTSPEERAAWQSALSLDTVESYRDFLRQFPQGAYAQQAALELQSEEQELAQLSPLGQPSGGHSSRPPY